MYASGSFTGLRRAAWFITGRHGGFSSAPFDAMNLAEHVGDDLAVVARNRGVITEQIGADHTVWMAAEHGARVHHVVSDAPAPPADILITTRSGVALAALAADCVPIAFAAPAGVIGVAHVGWRGLVADTVTSALAACAAVGARDLSVVVGPAICGACYPVPAERIDEVRASCPTDVAEAALSIDGHIDVRGGVLRQLAAAPLVRDVDVIGGCTATTPALYSYRRDARTGRHAMIAVMADD